MTIKNELCSHPYVKNSPINILDAMYGGRTDATGTYYRAKQVEEIRYGEVICLYSFICKYGKFPVGHPKVCGCRLSPDCLDREGIMKHKVLPPRKLPSGASV